MTVYVSAYGRCPPIVIWVECKSGPRSEPDVCTEEGGTRVSAYVARLSNKIGENRAALLILAPTWRVPTKPSGINGGGTALHHETVP